MSDKYKHLDEFKEDIELGLDVIFELNGIEYGIFYQDDGYVIAVSGSEGEVYKTSEDLINNHYIDGKLLKDLVTEFKIIQH